MIDTSKLWPIEVSTSIRLTAWIAAISVLLLKLVVPANAGETAAVPLCGLYTYQAEIVRVIDGDTVVANIDLGFRTWLHDEHLRLYGIDAPERGSGQAEASTLALRNRIEGKTVFVCTTKAKRSNKEATGSFGRYSVTIYNAGENVNDWMLREGLAVIYQ